MTVPTYTTTADMIAAFPFIRAKVARYRFDRLFGRLGAASADEVQLYEAFMRLQGEEAAKAAKESAARRRAVNVHKKPLRAARRREAALYGFSLKGGKVATHSIGG